MKRLPFLILSFCFIHLLFSNPCIAQIGVDCDYIDPTGPIYCECPQFAGNAACPIDGGVVFLIVAGIGLGGKKAFKERKKLALTQS